MTESEFYEVGDAAAAFKAVPSGASLPPMVDFRGHDGRLLALPYTRLASVVFDHTGGITLDFGPSKVLVRGRNLEPLYDALVEHRVRFIQEGDLDVLLESEPFVDSIVVASPEPELELE